jgi:nifR3 family TIM-barrel protein
MAEAAAALEEMGFDLVDLNLGCPAPKITRAGAGAALLAHPRKAQALFERVARALRRIPATVKTRIGLKDPSGLEASEIARLAEGSGIAAVAVHGRTREARYSGPADLGAIARVKAAVRIPVLGNGGVFTPEDAAAMREATGCDGVMVGRGGLGNPWLYRAAEAALEGRPQGPGPEPGSRREAALRHLALELEIEGERAAALNMRRAACWYFAGLPGAAAFRAEICRAATTARQRELIEKFQLP